MNPARRTTAAAATAVVLATAGGLLTAVATPASAAVTCASPVFKRQFFANTTFSGTPKKTDCDSAIDQSWSGAPATGLPKDNFGVRWTLTRDFGSGGPFSFAASGLDGIRVYLDGVRKIDMWKNVSTTVSKTVNVTIPSGKHTLRVDYVNWTGSAKVKFGYTPRTSATVDTVKPLTPTGTSLSYDAATGKAKLTWAKNKEMDLAGYRVFRRLKGAAFPGTPLATTTTSTTTYTDATLPVTGDIYYYEVRAYDRAGNVSTGTADQAVTTVDRTAPDKVTGLSALGTTAGNSLTWQASSSKDVDHYEVWGAPVGEADPDGPQPVWGTSWTDTTADPGKAYTYTVQAVDAARNFAPLSDPATVTRPVASGVPAPASLQATPADAHTRLTWTPSEGDVTGYRVYRRIEAIGGWALLGSAGASETSYDDTSAPQGKAYYYVAAVDSAGVESVPSGEVTVDRLTPATASGPAAPRLTLVSSGGTRSPIQVTAKPGAGDEGRLLKGYSWEIDGACGFSGTRLSTTGSIEWIPPYNGPCMVTVYAVDAYGRVGGQSSSLEFMVAR
ncbi:PA14 domain-containing protein [Streptomyces sp. DT2A-34]|uniref:fibronectin type III domain-containing protein n=1 Tax=Streptomyces sp. DT2A-34 TaxID=3051182 RepID=UPI00265C7EE2|nr:PA14 domain-containing protein [Streptomyces sp. DT2A-34]MDO0913167.1 PA14 domain-containing protein [Streptomyces sp. DT2A-34]